MDESDIIDTSGYQTGVLKTRQTLLFGYDANITAEDGSTVVDAHTVDGSANGQGYRMIRAGKVTGVSLQFDCTDATVSGDLKATLQLNASNQTMLVQVNTTSTGDLGGYSTANSFTFSAGDTINVELDLSEDAVDQCIVNNVAIVVEIMT